jgi:hypothetical protein
MNVYGGLSGKMISGRGEWEKGKDLRGEEDESMLPIYI